MHKSRAVLAVRWNFLLYIICSWCSCTTSKYATINIKLNTRYIF